MKKTVSFLLVASMCATLSVGLSGCAEDTTITAEEWQQAFDFDVPMVNFDAIMDKGTEDELSVCMKFNEESLYLEGWGADETYIVKIENVYYLYSGDLENGEMIYDKYDETEEHFFKVRDEVISEIEELTVYFEYDTFGYNPQTKNYEAKGVWIEDELYNCSIVIKDGKVSKITSVSQDDGRIIQFAFSYDNVEIVLPSTITQ